MVDNAEVSGKKLMIVRFETHQEMIWTDNPKQEIDRLIQQWAGNILAIMYDGQIIYSKEW